MKDRKGNRLKNYDYSSPSMYFVTICTKDRINYFGEIKDEKMSLNESGKIVERQWLWLKDQYPYVKLHEFIVMPNHFHGVLEIVKMENIIAEVGTGRDLSVQDGLSVRKIKSLSELIGAFKTTSSKWIHRNGQENFAWHRSFHESIVDSAESLNRINQYIINNPSNWAKDKENKRSDEEINSDYYNNL